MKKELKTIVNGIIGGIVGTLMVFTVSVAAEAVIDSGAVSYSNSRTNETTVNGALNELFSAVDINERLGNTDISSIGNGTISGAISSNLGQINSLKSSVSTLTNNINTLSNKHSSDISSINTSLSGKQATITGGASTIASSNLTASRALVSNSSGKVAVSAVTSTELGYLDGVTSNVQTQINAVNSKATTKSISVGLYMSDSYQTYQNDALKGASYVDVYISCSTAQYARVVRCYRNKYTGFDIGDYYMGYYVMGYIYYNSTDGSVSYILKHIPMQDISQIN